MPKVNEEKNLAVPSSESAIIPELNAAPSPLRKLEIEERLEKVALDGLVNIYHAITGKSCERYVSLGMATSAVSTLRNERDTLLEENARLKQHIKDLDHDIQASVDEANWQNRQGDEYGSY